MKHALSLLILLFALGGAAAQTSSVPISSLPTAATPLTGAEYFPLVQSGATRKARLIDITGSTFWRLDRSDGIPFKLQYNLDGAWRDVDNAGLGASFPAVADAFGALGNGVTDDRTAILNAANSLGSNGGIVLLSCGKNYRVGTDLTLPANVTLRHCRGYGGNPGIDWTTGQIASQPHIKLDGTASIIVSSNSGLDGVILRAGLTPPVQDASSYTGTAIKYAAGANDVRLRALIVGFATCVDGSAGGDRYDWEIECDGNPPATSGAVIIGPSFDSSRARIRAYPWGTVAHATPVLTRTGYGTLIFTAGILTGGTC